MTTYPYDYEDDFGSEVNEAKLRDEINAYAEIIPHCSDVGRAGGVINVTFLGPLSVAEEAALADVIIPAHDSSPSADDTIVAEISNIPSVHVRKPSGLNAGRVYGFSVNFCDRSTWYHGGVKVADEAVGTGDGTTTAFSLDHGTGAVANEAIVDMSHGKLSEENNLPNPDGNYREMGNGYGTTYAASLSGYVPIIEVDGVEKTERSYGETAGGDYEINYTTGALTFYTAPGDTLAITATYYYAPADIGPRVLIVPGTGRRFMVDRVEIQSSPDSCPMTDIVMGVYVGAPPPYGVLAERPTVVKNIYDIVNWAYGSRPQIESQGDGNPRALNHKINVHQVLYASEIPLLSSYAMYMQVNLASPIAFAGTWATIVIYGIEEPE